MFRVSRPAAGSLRTSRGQKRHDPNDKTPNKHRRAETYVWTREQEAVSLSIKSSGSLRVRFSFHYVTWRHSLKELTQLWLLQIFAESDDMQLKTPQTQASVFHLILESRVSIQSLFPFSRSESFPAWSNDYAESVSCLYICSRSSHREIRLARAVGVQGVRTTMHSCSHHDSNTV